MQDTSNLDSHRFQDRMTIKCKFGQYMLWLSKCKYKCGIAWVYTICNYPGGGKTACRSGHLTVNLLVNADQQRRTIASVRRRRVWTEQTRLYRWRESAERVEKYEQETVNKKNCYWFKHDVADWWQMYIVHFRQPISNGVFFGKLIEKYYFYCNVATNSNNSSYRKRIARPRVQSILCVSIYRQLFELRISLKPRVTFSKLRKISRKLLILVTT